MNSKLKIDLINSLLNKGETSVNLLGELLRDFCFRGKNGACSHFNLIDGFTKKINPSKTKSFLQFLLNCAGRFIHLHYNKKYNLYVFWSWGGYGTLGFYDGKNTVINNDCKKSHGWKIYK
ncbi:MAG: hypothetical protein AABY22_19930 [Nanoarchaeota archaeon]